MKVIIISFHIMFALNSCAQTDLEIPISKVKRNELILKRTGYTISYNEEFNLPNWVAWKLGREHLIAIANRKDFDFNVDPDINVKNAVTPRDYSNSGYDRGHMCPAGDNRWSKQAMKESFYMTNICPQHPNLNGGDWHELEKQCRRWAVNDKLYIICGPILYKNATNQFIGSGDKIRIPEAFFKVILTGIETGNPKAIGFIYKNSAGNKPLDSYINSIDQVERITGLDFFSKLPDDIEDKIEKECNIKRWIIK